MLQLASVSNMNRRILLSAFGTTMALGGCLSDDTANENVTGSPDRSAAGSDIDSVRDRFASEPDRPECTKESETVKIEPNNGEINEYETEETIPYPDPLANFTTDTLVEYAVAFEKAYITQNVLCDGDDDDYVLDIATSIEQREAFDWYDGITIVYLQRVAGASHGISSDGVEWQSDIGHTVACYAIDETGVARVQTNYQSPGEYESNGPDPIDEGTLLFVFE